MGLYIYIPKARVMLNGEQISKLNVFFSQMNSQRQHISLQTCIDINKLIYMANTMRCYIMVHHLVRVEVWEGMLRCRKGAYSMEVWRTDKGLSHIENTLKAMWYIFEQVLIIKKKSSEQVMMYEIRPLQWWKTHTYSKVFVVKYGKSVEDINGCRDMERFWSWEVISTDTYGINQACVMQSINFAHMLDGTKNINFLQ